MNRNFRFAFNGFNRSDVVSYLEFLNRKHTEQVNQLTLDNEMLRQQLNAKQHSDVSEAELEELRDRLEAVTRERDALMEKVAVLESERSEAAVTEASASDVDSMQELEAYRRAERAEREARERAEKILTSAEEFVRQAIVRAQSAVETYDEAARQTNARMNALLTSVDDGRQAMLRAVEQLRKINMD